MAKSIPQIIRDAIADYVVPIAGPMRTSITITPMTGRATYGPTYGVPFVSEALVEATSQVVTSADGTEKVSASKFTFFEPVAIKEGDRITLNGVTATVIKVGGLLDENGVPYIPEAWTGR